MKKIKNSDFIIQLPDEVAGKELSTGDYVTMRLHTVNAENYTEFRYEGGQCPEQQKVDAYRMANMESGVVQMIVESHIVDISMPDGYFDLALQQTTDYYWIKTASESSQEQINELRERLAEEEQVREAADDALEAEISGLTESIEELQSDLDSNYYLADEVDELLEGKLDVSAYTPVDIDNYYTKAEVDDAISASVEDNKVLYVQFTEVSEGSTALTCSHTFEQIYKAYSNGRVVVGQFKMIDLRLLVCKEDAYMFNGMYSNRTCYVAGSKNSMQEEHIGYNFIDLQVQMDDVPTQDSQNTVKSAGVFDALQDKLDVSAYTPYDDTQVLADIAALQTGKLDASAYTPTDLSNYYTKTEVNTSLAGKVDTTTFNTFSANTWDGIDRLDQVKLDASEYTPYDDAQVLADIAALQTNKLDASAYTPTDLSNYYTKAETNAAISGKVDTSVFENTEQATSALLNDLNDRKLDVSAYTPVNLSNYYNKTEVDGLVNVKLNTSDFNTYSAATASQIGDINTALNNINGNS